jgi:hypothetical protein
LSRFDYPSDRVCEQISNVPADAPATLIRAAFLTVFTADYKLDSSSGLANIDVKYALSESYIKGIYVRFQQSEGLVVLAFWDLRDAARARRACLQGRIPLNAEGLGCRFITVPTLQSVSAYR